MQVDLVVVLLTHVAWYKALVLQWIRSHYTSSYSLLNLVVEFFHAADAHFFVSVTIAPDRKWGAPVARTGEVPVVEVFEPLAEASCTCALRLPLDGLVQFKHAVFLRCRFDEPRVERVVEHGFVGTPAMRIVVDVLLNLERRSLLFHLQTEHHIQVHILVGSFLIVLASLIVFGVVGVLDEVAAMLPITVVHTELDKLLVHVVLHKVFTCEVHHWTGVASLVDDEEGRDACILCHLRVISTKGWSDVYDTCTILCGHIVTRNHTECFVFLHYHLVVLQSTRLHPRHQLLVVQAHEVSAFSSPQNLWLFLFAKLEICRQTRLCQDVDGFLIRVRILSLDGHIVNLGAYTESRVGWKCPRRGCPCEDISRCILIIQSARSFFEEELRCHRRVFHIAITTRLVQLMRGKTCTRCWRIRLNRVALIKQALVVELLQEIPQRLNVLVVVCDVWMFQIHPIAHLVGEFCPLVGVHHHVLATSIVIIIHANFLADVLLRDAQRLLHTQLHWKSVGVPTSLALHLETLHGLISEECVLYRASHYVVNARMSVGGRGTFKKDELRTAFAFLNALVEHIFLVPLFQNLPIHIREVQFSSFCKLH